MARKLGGRAFIQESSLFVFVKSQSTNKQSQIAEGPKKRGKHDIPFTAGAGTL